MSILYSDNIIYKIVFLYIMSYNYIALPREIIIIITAGTPISEINNNTTSSSYYNKSIHKIDNKAGMYIYPVMCINDYSVRFLNQ